jgi:hypothetical protein
MNDLLITRLPTLCNAEKLTPAELLQQYQRLEGEAIDQAQKLSDVCAKLHQMNVLAHNLSAALYALCDSFEAGDQAAILLQVKQLSERRAAQKAKVH